MTEIKLALIKFSEITKSTRRKKYETECADDFTYRVRTKKSTHLKQGEYRKLIF